MCQIAAFEHTKQRLPTQLTHHLSYLKAYTLLGFLFTFSFFLNNCTIESPKCGAWIPWSRIRGPF